MRGFKKSGGHSLIYLGANLASAAVPFFLLPILARLLDPAEYGQVAIFHAFVNVALAIVGVNTIGAVKRRYFMGRVNAAEADYPQFVSASLAVLVASFSIALAIVWLSHDLLEALTGFNRGILLLGVSIAATTFLINLRLGDYQIRGRALAYGATQLGNALANFMLSLAIVIFFSRSAEGRILGIALSSLAFAIFALGSLRKNNLIRFPILRPMIKDAIAFGAPLIPHALGVFFLASADRFFIKAYWGLESVGVYAAAVQITFLLRVISDAVNKSLQPWIFDYMSSSNPNPQGDGEIDRLVVGALYQVFGLTVCFAAALVLVGPALSGFLLGENFHGAGELIPVLAIGTAFHSVYLYLINILLYARRTGVLATTTIIIGLINLGLLFILVPRFGAQGAAISFLLASLMRVLAVFVLCQRAHRLPWLAPRFRGGN